MTAVGRASRRPWVSVLRAVGPAPAVVLGACAVAAVVGLGPLDRGSVVLNLALATRAEARADVPSALAAWDRVAARAALSDRDLVRARLSQARSLAGAGRCDEARGKVEGARADWPLHPRVAFGYAEIAESCRGVSPREAALAAAAARLDPSPVVAAQRVIEGGMAEGRTEGGVRLAREMLAQALARSELGRGTALVQAAERAGDRREPLLVALLAADLLAPLPRPEAVAALAHARAALHRRAPSRGPVPATDEEAARAFCEQLSASARQDVCAGVGVSRE